MQKSKLLLAIGRKESDKEKITNRILKNPQLLSYVLEGLNSKTATIKYSCLKILRLISEQKPEILYPKFDFFINLLNSDNSFMKWGAIYIIANLTVVDSNNKFEKIFNRYFSPIPGPVLITSANTIESAATIALAKPKLLERIKKELLKAETAIYQTAECRNVALGHVINSFDQFYDKIKDKEPVIAMITRQLENTRSGTSKKAAKFLKKYKIAPY
jgi:hypothetical protein